MVARRLYYLHRLDSLIYIAKSDCSDDHNDKDDDTASSMVTDVQNIDLQHDLSLHSDKKPEIPTVMPEIAKDRDARTFMSTAKPREPPKKRLGACVMLGFVYLLL